MGFAKKNHMQAATAQGKFKMFGKSVESAGMTKLLSGTDLYTIFAPTDAAFQQLPSGELDTLLPPETRPSWFSCSMPTSYRAARTPPTAAR
jgi:uncharacterized surface protein with fasciclin (FAS1) repeats